jgi:hypothetical protein
VVFTKPWNPMKESAPLRLTGLLLMASGLLLIVCFELLRQAIQYPDVLRAGTAHILELHAPGRAGLLPLLWYGMALGSLIMLLGNLLLHYCLQALRVPYRGFITAVGTLAALFNVLGYLRWVFLVPALAAAYTDPQASAATRDAVQVVFQAFHLYLGVTVGEHLGFLFLGLWGTALSVALWQTAAFPSWLSGLGVLSAVGTALGVLEGAGWAPAARIVEVCASLLIVWIVLLGYSLLRRHQPAPQLARGKVGRALRVGVLMLVAGGAWPPPAAAQSASPVKDFSPHELSLNAFRNPSIGLEYRYHRVSVHGGYYPTIISKNEAGVNQTTSFVRLGVSYWFWPLPARHHEPSSPYASLSYVRGLDQEWKGQSGTLSELGFRWVVLRGLNLRLGVALLAGPGRSIKVNPTPGISYSLPLGRR